MSAKAQAVPESIDELLRRARRLAGWNLGALAEAEGFPLPEEPRRAKGWIGQLLERSLGATAGSRAVADFEALGVELKTLPVDPRGQPRESTFVTSLDLTLEPERHWESSRLRAKLACVLWVPVEAAPLPLLQRRVGWAVLWSPTPEQEATLREDYERVVELHEAGLDHRLTARLGQALQVRPKGANARALRWSLDAEGAPIRTSPRGFYLRSTFTRAVLRDAWVQTGEPVNSTAARLKK